MERNEEIALVNHRRSKRIIMNLPFAFSIVRRQSAKKRSLVRIAACSLFALLFTQFAPSASAVVFPPMNIPSTTAWTDTGINVSAGDQLIISAAGLVVYGPIAPQVTGPGGTNYDGTQFFADAVYPSTTIVSLIGKVGGSTTVGTGAAVPEGAPGNGLGYVGTSYNQIMTSSGRLFLGFNDRVGFFGDNSGSFTVNIQVIPEPSTLALAGLGAFGLLFQRRLKKS
jgi:hypothetical protein